MIQLQITCGDQCTSFADDGGYRDTRTTIARTVSTVVSSSQCTTLTGIGNETSCKCAPTCLLGMLTCLLGTSRPSVVATMAEALDASMAEELISLREHIRQEQFARNALQDLFQVFEGIERMDPAEVGRGGYSWGRRVPNRCALHAYVALRPPVRVVLEVSNQSPWLNGVQAVGWSRRVHCHTGNPGADRKGIACTTVCVDTTGRLMEAASPIT